MPRVIGLTLTTTAMVALGVGLAAGCKGAVLQGVAEGLQSDGGDGGEDQGPPGIKITDKVDLLLVVDNSPGMGAKQELLAQTVPDLIARFTSPQCLDASGGKIGVVDSSGHCASGTPEFKPIRDLHVGVISTSLGSRGSDNCLATETSPVDPALSAHKDDRAMLLTRSGADERDAQDAPDRVFTLTNGDVGKLAASIQDVVRGVHAHGCGYEAQLESMYRFLVQPDPYETVVKVAGVNRLNGVSRELLKMRHDFLRNDSALAIVLLTDENDSTIDPTSFGGRSWFYMSAASVKPGTTTCENNPSDPNCLSCYLAATQGDPACAAATKPMSDPPNLRFFQMKRRFGVDVQFPVERYTRGLTLAHVPNRDGEHPLDEFGIASFSYVGKPECTNPLFAATLPTDPNADLCHLAPGPRRPDSKLVFFEVIAGVPWQLLTTSPGDMSATNSAPFKSTLDDADWTRMVGTNPRDYDFSGADPHMMESITARDGIGADDAHTDEWDTRTTRLQYACTFDLPTPLDCTTLETQGPPPANAPAAIDTCDCLNVTTPVCTANPADQGAQTLKTKDVAFPAIRELSLAKQLGTSGVVGSICPRDPRDSNSPAFGYRPAMHALVDRMRGALAK